MSAEETLNEFIDRFSPEVAQTARESLAAMRKLVPPCIELVYDNYNGLVIGFTPDRPSNAVFSIAVFPTHVSLCFLQGAALADPNKLFKGTGNTARHVRLSSSVDLHNEKLVELIATAMLSAKAPFHKNADRKLVIQSISAKQKPRCPASKSIL